MAQIYYIGGSPCSGKSTIAESLSDKYGLKYFKVDDFLDKYIDEAMSLNKEVCSKIRKMTSNEIWMRSPELQCKEELQIYEEIFEFVKRDLSSFVKEGDVITEAATFLPLLIKQENIPYNQYISITPTREFQISHYEQREWVPYVLEGCQDKKKAFSNWMERDVLFAKEINRQCEENRYLAYINGGQMNVEDVERMVSIHFGFEKE